MRLHNKFCKEELKKKMEHSEENRIVLSFYKYFSIKNPTEFRDRLYLALSGIETLGRIYVAEEGINAQISIPQVRFNELKDTLISVDDRLEKIDLNTAVEHSPKAFFVLKVKHRKQIVADNIDDPGFDPSNTGAYLNAEEFNSLSEQKDTLVVDMRNHYEYEVGHFQNAITYSSDTFRDQIPGTLDMLQEHKEKNIILYCTGGIRCEKASAFLKRNGFEKIFHIKGGIINYKKQTEEKGLPNKFIGRNFVFDERLGEKISADIISKCHQCGKPCDTHTNCRNEACHLLFIQCEECAARYDTCCGEECKETMRLPKEARKEKRKGLKNGQNIFNKSKGLLAKRFG